MAASLFHVLNISRQDMLSKLNDLDGSANNLANSNTVGYKPVRSNFQELLDNMTYGGTLQTGSQVLTQQGTLKSTNNPMDVAIQGDGFFAVTYATGKTGYSRDGQFSLDANNNLVNSSGFPLVWNGTIPAGAEEIQFQENGVVQTRIGDTWTQAGTIQLYRVPNPTGLQLNGNNVYITTTNSGTATAGAPGTTHYGVLAQSTLEQSNVNMAQEMTHLITLQRGFQLSTRVFQSTDTMISQAIHVRKA
jgi:flagellar basal-body rod protein FlgG